MGIKENGVVQNKGTRFLIFIIFIKVWAKKVCLTTS